MHTNDKLNITFTSALPQVSLLAVFSTTPIGHVNMHASSFTHGAAALSKSLCSMLASAGMQRSFLRKFTLQTHIWW